jgi:methionyl-tRNA formyltransferase
MSSISEPERNLEPTRVLFFGRKACDATTRALSHLGTLGCNVTFFESSFRGEKLPKESLDWNGEFIFCFRSLFLIPKELLEKASIAAVNFHPGPKTYPGTGGINFALYEGDPDFGVTAHIMNEKIDNGPILECRRFPIRQDDSVDSLLHRTHTELLELFLHLVSDFVKRGPEAIRERIAESSEEKWVGEARGAKELDDLSVVELAVTKEELERVIRATHTKKYPTKIYVHGHEFQLNSATTRP